MQERLLPIMSTPPPSDAAKAAKAASTLDALLSNAVRADQRANKPPGSPAPTQVRDLASKVASRARQNPGLERLTVRFTHAEARKLEEARAVARAMGFKLSDTAVFRLALSVLRPDSITPDQLIAVLVADTRRKR
jgi:hypothetical protein